MIRSLAVAVVFSLVAVSARADILIGSYGDGGLTPQPLRAFADDADGDALPLRVLGGPQSTIVSATGGSFEANEGVVYVADFWGQAIRVFPAYADGDVAPLRVLDAPILGQARTVLTDAAHGELLTTASGCCLVGFALDASGSAPWLHLLDWGGSSTSVTQLNYPGSLAYLAASDEVALTDSDFAPSFAPKVLVFNRADAGNTAPKRVIKGELAGLGGWLGGIAWDAQAHVLFVGANTRLPDGSVSARILAFHDDDDGDVAPLRVIAGTATGLELPSGSHLLGLAIDPLRRRLVASISADSVTTDNKLLVFGLDDDGDVAPLQVIAGPGTGMQSIGAPVWIPPDAIFDDAFDGPA
ncbi:hypothetical protein [Dokdonella sp.]|uniref:hypothetical protein n=1 Tax=Dokdonella sp. TaxID=2291710 RepID=UPI002F411AF1